MATLRNPSNSPHLDAEQMRGRTIYSESESAPQLELWPALLKAVMLTFGFLALFVIMTLGALGWFVNSKLTAFSKAAGSDWRDIFSEVKVGLNRTPTQTNNHKNFLILGIDSLATRGDVPPLTDTMIIASMDLKTGSVGLLPLPRDIWHPEYQAKINSLYAYGQQKNAENPQQFPTEALSKLTNITIHHTIVISLDQLAELIDLLGGIDVNVENAFTDPQFPNPNVDVTVERDPAKLYQTVSFGAGPQQMSGERALIYIRSRHSSGQEGDDIARAKRQQQVINALVTKLTAENTWKEFALKPEKLGKIYKWYDLNYQQSLPLVELVSTVKELGANLESSQELTPQLTSHQLSIYPELKTGVIWHPPISPKHQKQWVYEIRDLDSFQQEIRDKLQL
jgi:anionic cell wall polymer biosynthesis LytR-Cps2A-Psr (LCP) family protein